MTAVMDHPSLPRLAAYDVIVCSYLAIIGLLTTIFAARVPHWWWYPLVHSLLILGIIGLANYAAMSTKRWVHFARYWYPALLIPFIFSELPNLVHPINPRDLDVWLSNLDFALFGVHPTLWMERVTVPWLTEYLQWMYSTYYFLPFFFGAVLYRQGRYGDFREFCCVLMLGYLLSYLGYFMTPARGPRILFAEEYSMPLVGVWLTTTIQQTLDTLEGVQWDACPSGHTAVAIIVLVQAIRQYRPLVWPLTLIVISLVLSTVYLRYHYVVDVLAGIVLAFLCLGITAWIYRTPRPTDTAVAPAVTQEQLL